MLPSQFTLKSPYVPTGDQPQAIEKIVAHLEKRVRHQTLLGVTGSGKTFTMANVIASTGKPTLVISHNKTLAAQLYQEFKNFFPENAVHYFVSYYDYYQPEAYIPQSDTYIEKDAKINALIDSLRHGSTASILSRRDVVIVASVSCIYGIGDPAEYEKVSITLKEGEARTLKELSHLLISLQYVRNPLDPREGHFRIRENTLEIHLPSGEEIISVSIEGEKVAAIETRMRSDASEQRTRRKEIRIFPAKHFVTPKDTLSIAIANIRQELVSRLKELKKAGKILEAARLKQRTEYDLEMLQAAGFVNGIENYSRQLDFRAPGTPPHTLIDFFRHAYGEDFLTFIDESHATLPQMRGMERGDHARKQTLVDYGFRLPSAVDNRPLTFAEFSKKVSSLIYVSATPAAYELQKSTPYIAEQLIRPTGILDPTIEVRPCSGQVQNVIDEVRTRIARGERSLVMALTKRLAEDITDYLKEAGINAAYLHSEVKTLDRPDILTKLRTGEHDVLVGINLLREGLDLPEVSFIAILDADKEGFLRNQTTLLQIIGRAARHTSGHVILYADTNTNSMKAAIRETERRRVIQTTYNREHAITPQSIKKEIGKTLAQIAAQKEEEDIRIPEGPRGEIVNALRQEMKKASHAMNFELAARIRDRIQRLTKNKQ